MNKLIYFALIIINFVVTSNIAVGQCEVSNEVSPTGVFIETTKKEIIYFNHEYSIYAQVKHDGDDYFLIIRVNPMVKKEKYQGSMNIILENKDSVSLVFYDVKSRSKDTSISLFYRIEKDQIENLFKYNISEIVMDFDQDEKRFVLVLHKDVIKNQLHCLKKEDD